MYIVTIDNPHYPSISYFDNLSDAEKYQDEQAEIHSSSEKQPKYNAKVTLCEVINYIAIGVDY